MKLDVHPVTGEPREYLKMSHRRVKLRTPEAVARRRLLSDNYLVRSSDNQLGRLI